MATHCICKGIKLWTEEIKKEKEKESPSELLYTGEKGLDLWHPDGIKVWLQSQPNFSHIANACYLLYYIDKEWNWDKNDRKSEDRIAICYANPKNPMTANWFAKKSCAIGKLSINRLLRSKLKWPRIGSAFFLPINSINALKNTSHSDTSFANTYECLRSAKGPLPH